MNLAYIPAAPTRAALAFDAVVSTFNIYGGAWEAGAGAIFAENQALAWLVELLGWPATAGGCFVSGGTTGNLSALVAARQTLRRRRGRHPAGQWQLACTAQAHSSVQAAASVLDAEVVSVPEAADGRLTGEALRAALSRRSRRVRRGGVGRHDQCRNRRRPHLRGRRLRGVRRLAARRRRVRGSGARGAERAAAVRRHRARGQLHRRPAQVAVRPVRLLRPGLSPAGAGPGRPRPARQLSGCRRSGDLEPLGSGRPPVPALPRAAVLVQPGRARHRPLHRRHRAHAGDGPRGGRRHRRRSRS